MAKLIREMDHKVSGIRVQYFDDATERVTNYVVELAPGMFRLLDVPDEMADLKPYKPPAGVVGATGPSPFGDPNAGEVTGSNK